jgi:thioredoxin-dependent peroxiredoxin
MLKSNDSFPDFALADQDNKTHSKANYKGKWFAVYVYPKDDTPGCTVQGKAFTATRAEFEKAQLTVLGLSPDDVASHKMFCNKFSFSHTLLADPEAKLLSALGVGQSEWKGTKYWNRTTLLVDGNGIIQKVYENVNPEGHEQAILADYMKIRG